MDKEEFEKIAKELYDIRIRLMNMSDSLYDSNNNEFDRLRIKIMVACGAVFEAGLDALWFSTYAPIINGRSVKDNISE